MSPGISQTTKDQFSHAIFGEGKHCSEQSDTRVPEPRHSSEVVGSILLP
jgi:hypothetical protein